MILLNDRSPTISSAIGQGRVGGWRGGKINYQTLVMVILQVFTITSLQDSE